MRSIIRPAVTLALAITLSLCLAVTAWASGYWNVWQANLPDSGGQRAKTTPYGGSGSDWKIRMSWTSGTHDMNFVVIDSGGSWHIIDAFLAGNQYQPPSPYDWYIFYFGAAGGCENPTGDSTVFVNCRNAASL